MRLKFAVGVLLAIFGLSACSVPSGAQDHEQNAPPTQERGELPEVQPGPQGEAPGQEKTAPGAPMEADDVEGVDDYTATGFDGISQGFGNTFTYPDGFAVTAEIVATGQGGKQDYLEEQTRHDCSHTDGQWKVVSLRFDNFTGVEFKPNEISVPSFVNIRGTESEFSHSTYNPEDYEYWSLTDTVDPGESETWYDAACSAPDQTLGLLLEPTITTGESADRAFRGVLQWAEGGAQFSPPDNYTWPHE